MHMALGFANLGLASVSDLIPANVFQAGIQLIFTCYSPFVLAELGTGGPRELIIEIKLGKVTCRLVIQLKAT